MNKLEKVLIETLGLLSAEQHSCLLEIRLRPPCPDIRPRELAIVPDFLDCFRCKHRMPNRGRRLCKDCENAARRKRRSRVMK